MRLLLRLALAGALLTAPNPALSQAGVGGPNVSITTVPTIQAAAYASGNAVGSIQVINAFRAPPISGMLMTQLMLAWKGTETVGITFFIFEQNPANTTCTDRTAFVLGAADINKLATPPFTLVAAAPPVGTTSTSAAATLSGLSLRNKDVPPTANLYICAVSGGAFTPAVGDLVLKIAGVVD